MESFLTDFPRRAGSDPGIPSGRRNREAFSRDHASWYARPRLERELSLAARRRGNRVPQVRVGRGGGLAPARAPHHVADLEQEGLHHLGERLRLVVDGGRDGLETHRSALVLLDDRGEEPAIEPGE